MTASKDRPTAGTCKNCQYSHGARDYQSNEGSCLKEDSDHYGHSLSLSHSCMNWISDGLPDESPRRFGLPAGASQIKM